MVSVTESFPSQRIHNFESNEAIYHDLSRIFNITEFFAADHMMTSSNGNIFRVIHRSPVKSPHKDQWRGALMFSLICVWINRWVNNREGGDLRRYRAHYDVTVMIIYGLSDMKCSLNQTECNVHFIISKLPCVSTNFNNQNYNQNRKNDNLKPVKCR